MKSLYKKASRIRAHTWKDIGGIHGLLLDGMFLIFLLFVALVMVLVGFVALLLDYLVNPFLSLLSLLRRNPAVVDGAKTGDVLYPF